MDIIESNKLIAEFMNISAIWGGGYFDSDGDWDINGLDFLPNEMMESELDRLAICDIPLNELCFHKSWDWLMPVAIKIIKDNSSVFYIDKFHDKFSIHLADDGHYRQDSEGDDPLMHTYDCVVEFIKWVNRKQTLKTT